MLGTAEPCVQVRDVTLEVVLGLGSAASPLVLARQTVTLGCSTMACNATTGFCSGWHQFRLATPANLTQTQVVSVVLRNGPTSWFVGVAPASSAGINGGTASLVVSPLFATKYAQFTFRTHMDRPRPATGGQATSTGTSGTVTGSVVAVSALCAIVILAAIGFVYARRSTRASRNVDPVLDSEQLGAAGLGLGRAGGRKRPIRVRSAGGVEEEDDDVDMAGMDGDDDSLSWATRIADEEEDQGRRRSSKLASRYVVTSPSTGATDTDSVLLSETSSVHSSTCSFRLADDQHEQVEQVEQQQQRARVTHRRRQPMAIQVRSANSAEDPVASATWATRSSSAPTDDDQQQLAPVRVGKRLPRVPRRKRESSTVSAVSAFESDANGEEDNDNLVVVGNARSPARLRAPHQHAQQHPADDTMSLASLPGATVDVHLLSGESSTDDLRQAVFRETAC
jgi:hypothetical protein